MKGPSPVLAIGTQSKQVQLWDASKFERIRCIEGQHEGRVSALSWNPYQASILSSGSLDSQIMNNDVRIGLGTNSLGGGVSVLGSNNGGSSCLVSTYRAHR